MSLVSIKDLALAGRRVFLRCDFNVPQDDFLNITDDRRIREAIPTIRYCLDHGAALILASHLGRPAGAEAKFSLAPIAKRLSSLLGQEVALAADVAGPDATSRARALKRGEILLLENLRFEPGETKNDPELARRLAGLAEVYVNDAFGVCHRAHASVEAIARFFDERGAGFLLLREIEFGESLLRSAARPFVAVAGGSKISGKLQALQNLLPRVDKLLIGGGMAFTFLAAGGLEVGNSLLETELIGAAGEILTEAQRLGVKIYLPVDLIAAPACVADAVAKCVPAQEIPPGWMGLDIGPATILLFKAALEDANTIWWNGPMGVYELEKFAKGSVKLSHLIAQSQATTVVGGGDTADVVARAGDGDDFTFISTGGGASLELIEGKELPGIRPLRRA